MARNPTPDFPEVPNNLFKSIEVINRAMAPHRDRMIELAAAIDASGLGDLQRTAEKIQVSLAIPKFPDPELQRVIEKFTSQHTRMMDSVRLIDGATAERVLEAVPVTTTPEPSVQATTSTDPETASGSRRFTALQIFAASALLAGLHSYLMDLRDADLADAGTLMIVLAALIAISALLNDPEE